jgi:hypothetical protein
VVGRSTRSLDLTEMPWHIRHSRGAVNVPQRPVMRRSPEYFFASRWLTFGQVYLGLAISKLARAEKMSIGPTRALFRNKRLRAVAIFRRRFGEAPIVRDMQHFHPRERR